MSNGFFFELRARLAGAGEDLEAGTYQLRQDMSYSAALDSLSAGGGPAQVVSVTIPEGRARSEVGPIVEDAGLDGDYERATESSKLLDPADYGAEDAESLEGFLFPSTYELKPSEDVDDLVKEQLGAFESEFDKVDMSEAEAANLTPYDVLTIASMVERETLVPEERPIVASVIYNRLQQGEPLFIDATIRFAVDNWTDPLLESELAVDSPYNTRLNAGLPPGPIGSPGMDSIEAAANPANTDYLFYVVKPGTCGEHEFNETIEEFTTPPWRSTTRRGPKPAASRRRTARSAPHLAAGTARRRPRLSGRPQPLAGHPERRLPRAGPRLALRQAAGAARALRARPCARCRAPATAAPT